MAVVHWAADAVWGDGGEAACGAGAGPAVDARVARTRPCRWIFGRPWLPTRTAQPPLTRPSPQYGGRFGGVGRAAAAVGFGVAPNVRPHQIEQQGQQQPEFTKTHSVRQTGIIAPRSKDSYPLPLAKERTRPLVVAGGRRLVGATCARSRQQTRPPCLGGNLGAGFASARRGGRSLEQFQSDMSNQLLQRLAAVLGSPVGIRNRVTW